MMFWVLCKPDLCPLTLQTRLKAVNLLLIHGRKSDAGDRKQVLFLDLTLLLN